MRSVVAVFVLVAAALACAAPLLHADAPTVIPGSYIVVLKETLSASDKAAHIVALKGSIIGSTEDEVTGEFGIDTFQGYFARLSKSTLEAQLNHPDVLYVEADKIMKLFDHKVESVMSSIQKPVLSVGGTQTGATWGLARISAHAKPANLNTYYYNNTASPSAAVDCYIVDTGIHTAHVDFGGRAKSVFNAITGESGEDLNGHGTHVSGTVAGTTYGVHKTCNLFGVKVLGADGSGTNAGVIAGINAVATLLRAGKRSVANMSLGGSKSTALDSAVDAVVKKDVAFAVAAGNDNANACNYSPASASLAVSTCATTNTDARASFSNYGTCTHIFAPGQSITSDWIGSNTATSTISGTSMASPHVCGVLALHREKVTDNAQLLRAWIQEVATPNVVTSIGTGSTNLLLYAPYVA